MALLWTRLACLLIVWVTALTWDVGSTASLPGNGERQPAKVGASERSDARPVQLHRRSRRSRFSSGGGSGLPAKILNTGTPLPPLQNTAQLESTVLECEFSGTPPPTIDWLFNGQLLTKQSARNSVEEQSSSLDALLGPPSAALATTRSRLHLDCVTPAHQGTYTCQAQTPYDVESVSTNLFVEDAVSREGMSVCEEVKNTSVRPARIVQWRRRVLAKMGTSVRLVCENTGYPAPVVTWRKNDEPVLIPDPRVLVTPSGDLLIEALRWSDMGKYWCTAANAFSSDEISTFLYPFKG